jgi:hypothetical protein
MIKLEIFSNFTVVSKYKGVIDEQGIRMFELIAIGLSLIPGTYFAIVRALGGAFMGGA